MSQQLRLLRTDSQHPDFQGLITQLDAYLRITDGDEHDFYAQYNKLDHIHQVVLVYEGQQAVGCGAIKAYEEGVTEVKRMFVTPECRGRGIAGKILTALEQWAVESGFHTCILETGIRQKAAIRLYEKSGYQSIPNYGQYAEVENSVCMQKKIAHPSSSQDA
ncbi:MAG: GNAT family N-acetyltransferase [Bacteroidota bacterium]